MVVRNLEYQKSVFEGEITEANLYKLKKDIEGEIDESTDSVVIFKSRDQRWLDKDVMGMEQDDPLFI